MCLCAGLRRPVCFAPPALGWMLEVEGAAGELGLGCLFMFGRAKGETRAGSGCSPPPLPPPPRKSIRRTPLPVQSAAASPCERRDAHLAVV